MRREGSVVLLALVVCLGMALVVACVTAVLVGGGIALEEETAGRQRLAAIDETLAVLALEARRDWRPHVVDVGPRLAGELVESTPPNGSLLRALVRDGTTGRVIGTALVERGVDGLSLPSAVIVAGRISALSPREPAILSGSDPGETQAWLATGAPDGLLDRGVAVSPLMQPWLLGEGSLAMARDVALGSSSSLVVSPEPGSDGSSDLRALLGSGAEGLGTAPEQPVLVVWDDDLDASALGDLWGVILAGGGLVRLPGTTLHGALFSSGTVDVGLDGRIIWDREVFRWATDRSITRVRLVPGSRNDRAPGLP